MAFKRTPRTPERLVEMCQITLERRRKWIETLEGRAQVVRDYQRVAEVKLMIAEEDLAEAEAALEGSKDK